ncbi:MAG: methyltransferase domain-containing protein [Cyclobacteriaceae bacterium]|nr:methyltransferase domain-containing protein [Cyclobacteriaceae bacterium HetDA_MAG_MS6]
MNKFKYSRIGTSSLNYNSPFPVTIIEKMIGYLQIERKGSVVDIGAGKGYFTEKIVTAKGIQGVVVEVDNYLTKKIDNNKITVVNEDAVKYLRVLDSHTFSCSICFGSTHIFGGFYNTISELNRITKENGFLIVSELTWKDTPTSDFLKHLGISLDVYNSDIENKRICSELNFDIVYSENVEKQDWDVFEETFSKIFCNTVMTTEKTKI